MASYSLKPSRQLKYSVPILTHHLLWVILVGGSVMSGVESVVSGGGARTKSPKRHFFFLISFPDTNLRWRISCLVTFFKISSLVCMFCSNYPLWVFVIKLIMRVYCSSTSSVPPDEKLFSETRDNLKKHTFFTVNAEILKVWLLLENKRGH